jgi:hypothetical protein
MTPAEAKIEAEKQAIILTDLFKRKTDLENQITEAMNAKCKALEIIANDASPFKVGERCLLTHRGEKIPVEIAYVTGSVGGDKFEYSVRRVKKDGTLYERTERLWSWDSPKLSKMEGAS